MNFELEILLAVIVYLWFFAWNGRRRGSARELYVLIVAVTSWVILQTFGPQVQLIGNLIFKFIGLVATGGLGGENGDVLAAVSAQPDIITADNRVTFLFIAWLAVIIIAYLWTELAPIKKPNNKGWATILGMINGLFFAAVLLPRLVAMLGDQGRTLAAETERNDVSLVLRGSWSVFREGLGNLWSLAQPHAQIVIFLLVALVLLIAATSLRSGAKA
jgi:hypothetical protein